MRKLLQNGLLQGVGGQMPYFDLRKSPFAHRYFPCSMASHPQILHIQEEQTSIISLTLDILIRTTIGLRSLLIVEQFLQQWESIMWSALIKPAFQQCCRWFVDCFRDAGHGCPLFPWLNRNQDCGRTRWLLAWVESSNPPFSFVTIQDFSGDVVFSTRVTISWKPRYL